MGTSRPTSTSTTSTIHTAAPCEEGGSVWEAMAGGYSCGNRIQWVMRNVHVGDLSASKAMVASEYPHVCGACMTSSTSLATSTTTVTTTVFTGGIQSGDIIFLKAHGGRGNHIHVEG